MTKVLVSDTEVIPRLTELRLPKVVLLDILDRAAGERAAVNSSDPINTGGNEMRRWSTRFLREDPALKSLGWEFCDHDQLEGIRNDQIKVKLVSMNADARTGIPSKQPASISEKGAAAERRIKANEDKLQGSLFDHLESEDPIASYEFLYFCVHASEKTVAAEVSRPSELTRSHVTAYSERIILAQPGERPGIKKPNAISEDFAEVEKATIARKA